jgi:hypothetical protein
VGVSILRVNCSARLGRQTSTHESEVEFIMGIWQLEYFEAGASTAYMRETFYSAEAKDSAVALYARFGGDDVLKVTARRKRTPIRPWLKQKVLQAILLVTPHRALRSSGNAPDFSKAQPT